MTEALKKVLESAALSDSAKTAITEAWATKLQEAREELATTLRDEFAVKFEKDKSELVEAMDIMIREGIQESAKSLAEARKCAMAERVKTKKKLKEAIETMHAFMTGHLRKEMQEFHTDRKAMSESFHKLDSHVKKVLNHELVEFHDERRALAEDRVQFKINAAKNLAETKKNFIAKASTLVEGFFKKQLTNEMSQLRNELAESQKNHFGMKIFEAFAAEFGSSFYNERKEIKKLVKVIESQNAQIAEIKNTEGKLKKQIVESENKLRISNDRQTRARTMTELCGSLSGAKRKIMSELLEKVPTHKLTESFNLYLPAVLDDKPTNRTRLNEDASVSRRLSESTGNKETLMSKNNTLGNKAQEDVLAAFSRMTLNKN